MFFRNKRTDVLDQAPNIIGRNTVLKGTVTASDSLRIDGEVTGEVLTTSDLIVGVHGRVNAAVVARNAVVAGTVTGEMAIEESLELLFTAKILGNINVKSLAVDDGAVFEGNCEMLLVPE